MIQGVLFDMDGVMIDSERESDEAWLWAAAQKHVEMPKWILDGFKGAPRDVNKRFFDNYYHGKVDYDEMRQIRSGYVHRLREENGIPVKPGLFQLLDYIRDHGMKCAVATSTHRESAENTLHTIGAYDYLQAVVYGDSVEHGKPAPDIFLKAASAIGLQPDEVIVIEDSINGIKAGYHAGMRVVHVPDTIQITEDIRRLTFRVCDSLAEVPAILTELNTQN